VKDLPELQQLNRQWQKQPASPTSIDSIRRQVSAESRAHRRIVTGIAVAASVVMGLVYARAWITQQWDAWVTALVATAHMIVVWFVALWLARGSWRPRDESAAAHIEVSIRRCRSMIIGAPVGIALYVIGLIGALIWKKHVVGLEWSELLAEPPIILATWVGGSLFAGGMFWYARLQKQRLRVLLQMHQQLVAS
jgi:hypothetical protein